MPPWPRTVTVMLYMPARDGTPEMMNRAVVVETAERRPDGSVPVYDQV
jgi:hypothetical protein